MIKIIFEILRQTYLYHTGKEKRLVLFLEKRLFEMKLIISIMNCKLI